MRKDKKIFPYIVVLKQKNRFRVALLGIISAIVFILILLQRIFVQPSGRIINLLVLVTVSGIFFYNTRNFYQGKKFTMMPVYIVAFISLIIFPPMSWFAILFALLALLEKAALAPEEIGFGEEEIVFNSIVKKKIRWNELNNIILKDGLLTIDFINDHIIQRETEDDEDEEYDASEEEFNQYCKERLKKIADFGLRISD
jgi:hypothetical protein